MASSSLALPYQSRQQNGCSTSQASCLSHTSPGYGPYALEYALGMKWNLVYYVLEYLLSGTVKNRIYTRYIVSKTAVYVQFTYISSSSLGHIERQVPRISSPLIPASSFLWFVKSGKCNKIQNTNNGLKRFGSRKLVKQVLTTVLCPLALYYQTHFLASYPL